MKKNYRPVFLVLASFACLAVAATAQNPPVKKVPPRPVTSISGKDVYKDYCAACHGLDGKGNGPAAPSLKQHPADLTQIARQHGGKFPEDQFINILNGSGSMSAHGSADMPIWGSVFRNTSSDLSLAQSRIHSLQNYIEEMQAK
ncbi:MAG TPA: c-type cytochrome [Verrucomicrobiae bacterium]|nr:c-type cytochrome [Verrucomicrobiae bacterium]